MLSYSIKRLVVAVPVLLSVALFVFALLYVAPGDPAAIMAGDAATPEQIERIREALHLDRPFVLRFGEWIWALLHGDLGLSIFTGQPVATMVGQRLEPTILLMLLTLIVSVLVAIPLGTIAAWRYSTLADRIIMALAALSFSVPAFVVGYLLAYVFALQLNWLPVQGYAPLSEGPLESLRSLTLPALALGSVYVGLLVRITRTTMLEVLNQDYIRTARAKGSPDGSIFFRHALKNCAVPIITTIGSGVALLIGGAIVTETVFALPGVGSLTVDAVLRRDYPVIQGVVLISSFFYIIINLIVDILYTVFDPRIRY